MQIIRAEYVNEYIVGGLEQIKKDDFPYNFPKTTDVEEAKLVFPEHTGEGIISINLIGAYRRIKMPGTIPGEHTIEKEPRASELSELLHSMLGRKPSDIHHSLVQIGYDPKTINPKVLRDFLGIGNERLSIKPYNELKPLSNKEIDTFVEAAIKDFQSILEAISTPSPESLETIRTVMKNASSRIPLERLMTESGLSEKEYALLKSFQHAEKLY